MSSHKGYNVYSYTAQSSSSSEEEEDHGDYSEEEESDKLGMHYTKPTAKDLSLLMDYIPHVLRNVITVNEVIESCYEDKLITLFQKCLSESSYKRNIEKPSIPNTSDWQDDELDSYTDKIQKKSKFSCNLNPYDFVLSVLEDSDYYGEFYLTNRNKMVFIPYSRKKKKNYIDPVLGPGDPEITTDLFARSLDGFHFVFFLNRLQTFTGKETHLQIICLQHLKSIALFTCLVDIPITFIHFLFEEATDNFLRALALYFQYYLQLWDVLVTRTEMRKSKLPNQNSSADEDEWQQNLNDLRFFIARNYMIMIIGADPNMQKYHYLNKKFSIKGNDIVNHELLYHFSTQIMLMIFNHENDLRRKCIIVDEMNILFRVPVPGSKDPYDCLSYKDRAVLEGKFKRPLTWNVSTSCLLELKRPGRDIKLLHTGISIIITKDKRLRVLQLALLIPENKLEEANINIGILGKPRADYPPLLNCSQITSKDRNEGITVKAEPENITTAKYLGQINNLKKPLLIAKEFSDKPYNTNYSLLLRTHRSSKGTIKMWEQYARVSDRFWYKIDTDFTVVNCIRQKFSEILETEVRKRASFERRIKSLLQRVKRTT